MKNYLLLEAAAGTVTQRIPVWLMRQAGRVLSEYKQVRDRFKDFKDFVKNPEAAAEVTVQPVEIFGVDAAIIFSDILVVPEAMGLSYQMQEQKGPFFPKRIQNIKDVEHIHLASAHDLAYVIKAIQLTKKALHPTIPLIGFAGAPWTIFAYMTEGSGSKTFSTARKWLYAQPDASHLLLEKITRSTITYLKAQIEAGADIVQIFDSWAGVLPQALYQTFSAQYIQKICEAITEVPVIVFAKDAYFARSMWSKIPCRVVGMDWCMDIVETRKLLPNKSLQGNLDPCVLYADKSTIIRETKKMLWAFDGHPYIANLGHGLYPDIPRDNVKIFVDTVKDFARHA